MTESASEDRALIGAPTWLAWLLIVTGALGLTGAFALAAEGFAVLKNPDHELACDVSPFITCSTTMNAWQGEVFGFPNSFIGLMGFVAPVAVGVALLAGAKFAKWFWAAFTIGVIGALGFVLWLAWNSIFFLGVVCPWCFLVWIVVYTMVFPLFTHSVAEGVIPLGAGVRTFAKKHLTLSWLLSLALLIVIVLTIAVRLPDLIRLMFI